MFHFSPTKPSLFFMLCLSSIALSTAACSSVPTHNETEQSAPQSQNAQISPIDEVSPSTLEELYELYPETKALSDDVLREELAQIKEKAEELNLSLEEFLKEAIEETRKHDEMMRQSLENIDSNENTQSQ